MPLQEQKDDKVTVLANTTINELKMLLEELRAKNVEELTARSKIKIFFGEAFLSLSKKEEKRKLFRKISKYVHPDKLQLSSAVANYLQENNMYNNTLQIVLNEFQPLNYYNPLILSSLSEAKLMCNAFIDLYKKIKSLEEALCSSSLKQEKRKEIEIDLALKKEKSSEFPLDLRILLTMLINLFRYPTPVAFLVGAAIASFGISTFILDTLNTYCFWLVTNFINLSGESLLFLYTGGKGIKYRLEEYKNQQCLIPETKVKFLSKLKKIDNMTDMSDEEYLEECFTKAVEVKQNLTQAQFNNMNSDMKNSISPSLLIILKLVALSIYDTLTEWPKGTANRILTILLWPLRFMTAVPLLLLVSVQNFISASLNLTSNTLSGVLFLSGLGVIFVLNIPLILWDASSYLIRKIKNCCCAPKPNSAGEDEPLLISSQRRMSAALSSTQSPRSPSPPSSPRQQETSLHGEGLRENGNNGSSFNWQGPPLNLEEPSPATESPDRKQSPSRRSSVDRMDCK
jgi:hypothetical protein